MTPQQLQQQRLESIKAGCVTALSFGITYLIFVGINLLLTHQLPTLIQFPDHTGIEIGIKSAGALGTGFLFGVTYRYIIREDQDSHLQDGAVLAFGLVRSGAVIEPIPAIFDHLTFLSLVSIESILGFAVARWSLDFALSRQWVQPFPKGIDKEGGA